jgi:hypothetical protein
MFTVWCGNLYLLVAMMILIWRFEWFPTFPEVLRSHILFYMTLYILLFNSLSFFRFWKMNLLILVNSNKKLLMSSHLSSKSIQSIKIYLKIN